MIEPRAIPKAVVVRWNHFWFDPTPVSTIAVFRIVYGLLLVLWTIAMSGDAVTFFSNRGAVPERPTLGLRVGLFNVLSDSPTMVLLAIGILGVAAAAVMVGYRTRVASIVTWLILLSLARRNPYFANGGDTLVRILGLFLIFAPAGQALSFDAWRRTRDINEIWRFPMRAPWAQRLIQVQVSILYLFAGWSKARGSQWTDGSALATILRVDQYARFPLPMIVTDQLLISNVLSWGTIAVEIALATLVWNRRARPWVLLLGVGLHVFIEATMALAFFGLVTMTSYITFVPEDSMESWLGRVRERLRGSRRTSLRRLAGTG